jgi:hypothetical protein
LKQPDLSKLYQKKANQKEEKKHKEPKEPNNQMVGWSVEKSNVKRSQIKTEA